MLQHAAIEATIRTRKRDDNTRTTTYDTSEMRLHKRQLHGLRTHARRQAGMTTDRDDHEAIPAVSL